MGDGHVLWNHLRGAMFVEYQYFAGLLENDFVDNCFMVLSVRQFISLLHVRRFISKYNPRNPRTLIPHEQQ